MSPVENNSDAIDFTHVQNFGEPQVRFDTAFHIKRELFSEKQILSDQRSPGTQDNSEN